MTLKILQPVVNVDDGIFVSVKPFFGGFKKYAVSHYSEVAAKHHPAAFGALGVYKQRIGGVVVLRALFQL